MTNKMTWNAIVQPSCVSSSEGRQTESILLSFSSIQSDVPFDGAYGNLKRLFDKAAKMYHQVKKQEIKKHSPSQQR